MEVNEANFDSVCNMVIVGNKAAENYNRDCFGMSDLHLAMATSNMIQHLIDGVRDAGYDPYALVKPILEQHQYTYKLGQDPSLKQRIDDAFSLELDYSGQALSYCKAVHGDTLNEAV